MRKTILKTLLIPIFAIAAAAGETGPAVSPDEALARLMQGNQRFVKGAPLHGDDTPARRAELAAGQKPFAAVLACADSRVPPELLFDQGLGDIFTVRVAGNVAGTPEQGSLEYAAEHLGTPMIMVLGHTGCGAIGAAASGTRASGALGALLKQVEPAVKAAKARGAKGDEVARGAVEENVRLNAMALLRGNPVIRKLAAEGKLKVSAAVYDISTGEVRLLDLDKGIKEDRKARAAELRGLMKKWKAGDLADDEKARLMGGIAELLPEAAEGI